MSAGGVQSASHKRSAVASGYGLSCNQKAGDNVQRAVTKGRLRDEVAREVPQGTAVDVARPRRAGEGILDVDTQRDRSNVLGVFELMRAIE